MERSDSSETMQEGRAARLAALPASWFHLCAARELTPGPVTQVLGGKSYVGYRTESGRPVVLSGRCAHMGANLGGGEVLGERLVCPLHGWEFGADGVCAKIPAAGPIPSFARQSSYPVEERGGEIFFFNRKTARFPLPFFEGGEAGGDCFHDGCIRYRVAQKGKRAGLVFE